MRVGCFERAATMTMFKVPAANTVMFAAAWTSFFEAGRLRGREYYDGTEEFCTLRREEVVGSLDRL